jgi:hypothetical protein
MVAVITDELHWDMVLFSPQEHLKVQHAPMEDNSALREVQISLRVSS